MVIAGLLSSRVLMVAMLVLYGGLAVADLFKRHLLSNLAVYAVTMLPAPIAAVNAICAPVASLTSGSIGGIILTFVGGIALLLLVAAVYIRGHIRPAPQGQDGSGRMIVIGTVGTVLYGILTIVQLALLVVLLVNMGGGSLLGTLCMLLFCVFLLFVPILCIISIAVFIVIGVETLALAVAAVMALLMSLFTTNGCIRYIVKMEVSKGQKAWRIMLAFVPIVNSVMGIRYIAKNKDNYAYGTMP